jgi:hypothetical protein
VPEIFNLSTNEEEYLAEINETSFKKANAIPNPTIGKASSLCLNLLAFCYLLFIS